MNWPNAVHLHTAWSTCLLCGLDELYPADMAMLSVNIVADSGSFAQSMLLAAIAIREALLPAVDAAISFGEALKTLEILQGSTVMLGARPSPIGPWWPGRFA